MDVDLLRVLLPAITGVVGALIGAVVGGSVQWLANRSNARLQIEAQRQLAADTRRYERRREQVGPMVEFVRRQVRLLYDMYAAIGAGDRKASEATSEAMREEHQRAHLIVSGIEDVETLRGEYDAITSATITAMRRIIELSYASEGEARRHLGHAPRTKEPLSAEAQEALNKAQETLERGIRNALAPVALAATRFERAVDAYLDEVSSTTLTKRP